MDPTRHTQISQPTKLTSQVIRSKCAKKPFVVKISTHGETATATIQGEGIYVFDVESSQPIQARQATPGLVYGSAAVVWNNWLIVTIHVAPEVELVDKTVWIWPLHDASAKHVLQFDKDIAKLVPGERLLLLHADGSMSVCKDGETVSFDFHLPAITEQTFVDATITDEAIISIVKSKHLYKVQRFTLPDLDRGFEYTLDVKEAQQFALNPSGNNLAVLQGKEVKFYSIPSVPSQTTMLHPTLTMPYDCSRIQWLSQHHLALIRGRHLAVYEARFHTIQHESNLDVGNLQGEDVVDTCILDTPSQGTQLAFIRSILTPNKSEYQAQTLAHLIPYYCPTHVSLAAVLGKDAHRLADANQSTGTTQAEATCLGQLRHSKSLQDFEKHFALHVDSLPAEETPGNFTHTFVNAVTQLVLREHWSRKALLHLLRSQLVSASSQGSSSVGACPSLLMHTTLARGDAQALEALLRHVPDLREEDVVSAVQWTLAVDQQEGWKTAQQRKTELKHHFASGPDRESLTHGQHCMLQALFAYPRTDAWMTSAMKRQLSAQQVEALFIWAVGLVSKDEVLEHGTWMVSKPEKRLSVDQCLDTVNLILDAHLAQILVSSTLEPWVTALHQAVVPNVNAYRQINTVRGPLSAFEAKKPQDKMKEKGGKRWARMVQQWQATKEYGIEFIPI